ncbi:fused MFS/spermidine synthase [Sphingomonas sp. SUN019]|uniref:fused MFS/spermidine synthase n=1 Tax=Sphingomonas sp. SUN019 TaxID=2937788 RepID=UPI002164C9BD|nr:fused MFS/spermidine synthase [Sphingomonas sp. SUN019]UVO52394.1 fused MFS/spermidine synthase [Sphingomonas sp. SUN019]
MSKEAGRGAFVATILLGSFLLFLVQPMIARIALPRLGGAPAVWNSAMLVYQALLLGGYAYAHAIGRMTPRRQAAVHLILLAVAMLWLPIGVFAWTLPAGVTPALWVPWLLALSIGPLFVAVAAQAPLIQRWFASRYPGEDPYRLYAASNLGSFAGLIAYPLLVEPWIAVHGQRWMWTAGYLALIVLIAHLARRLPRAATIEAAPTEAAPTLRRVATWIALSFVPSGLMLATSTYITTDIVAMPLLWVLPLGLYLLSFSVAFAVDRSVPELLTRVAPITILLFGGIMIAGFPETPLLGAFLALALLFMASVALHTALYRIRPEPARLTGFYLAMAVGGALGGVFAGLIAPIAFDWTWEYPLLIFAGGAMVPQVYLTRHVRAWWHAGRGIPALAIVVIAMLALLFLRVAGPRELFGDEKNTITFVAIALIGLATVGARHGYLIVLGTAIALFGGLRSAVISLDVDTRTRSYFGVYTLSENVRRRVLAHGTTVHGIELLGSPARERMPTTYYVPASGVGQVMTAATALYGPAARIGVVGLGTGTLACYAKPGQDWRFYEIDPEVVAIARDPQRFRFLSRCLPDARIEIGDARLSLEKARLTSLDILTLDAFSSDSVPIHLLTREAFAVYGRTLSPRGVLAVHISNRFLDLEPVVAAAARAGSWHGLTLLHQPSDLDESGSSSQWIILSRDPAVIATLGQGRGDWRKLGKHDGVSPWTDDHASILPLLKF